MYSMREQARRNTEFWRGKISKGAHLSEVLGEGAKRPSGGGYPLPR